MADSVHDFKPLQVKPNRNKIMGSVLCNSEEEIIATFGPSEEGTIRKLIPMYEDAGIKAYLHHYKELHYTCPQPFSGIKELLQTLNIKEVQMAMVTGKGTHSMQLSLNQFGLAHYFKLFETGSPDGPDKVNGIRSVLNRMQVDARDSLYVGDAPSDILYCKEIGIPIAAAAWASTADAAQLQKLNPDWLFHSVDEFCNWILNYV